MAPTLAADEATPSYASLVAARQARFRPQRAALDRTSAYHIDAQFSVPHSGTHIHALAAPPCSSHIYTGGSDGFVRRYALYATLNGSGVDNPLVPNLTSKIGGHERPPGTDTRQPVLSGYWENEEPGDWIDDLLLADPEPEPEPTATVPSRPDAGPPTDRQARVRWGPKVGAWGAQSAVYSLAVQKEELWGLSGTSRGSVNLWTVRHDEGQIRHVFRPAASPTAAPAQGHSPKAAVSVLALDHDERSFLSGGWDGRIFQWDLDTGVAVRPFFAHSSQISSISYRPLQPPRPLSSGLGANEGDTEMADGEAAREEGDAEWIDAPGRIRTDEAADGGVRDGGASRPGPDRSANDPDAAASDIDADADADADGEIDDTLLPVSTAPHSILPVRKSDTARSDVPLVGTGSSSTPEELSSDVFASTAFDGTVLLWDRRAGEAGGGGGGGRGAKGLVQRFGPYRGQGGKSAGWCTSACWSPSGSHLYVARRSPAVDIYDLRSSSPLSTLSLPKSTGPVSAVAALPNGRHLLTASWDNVRLWDVKKALLTATEGPGPNLNLASGEAKSNRRGNTRMPIGATVVPGHYGGTVSSLYVDPTCRWMMTASGHRGWDGTSTENLVIHEIRTRPGALQ
ncbi:hypothetical protein JCM3774_004870 [Rhodotorula dairenensis]